MLSFGYKTAVQSLDFVKFCII